MKLIRLMTLPAATFIAGTTFAIADTPGSPTEAEKIKASLEAFGCTANEMEKSERSVFAFEVDDAKCKDGEYDIKLQPLRITASTQPIDIIRSR